MYVTRYNPRRELRDFRRGFDMLNSMLDEMSISRKEEHIYDFTPSINTREGEYAYHVELDLPGMSKEDIEIKLEDNTLIISGERKMKEEMKEENYYKIESSYGKFSRSFTLPDEVDTENIHAESVDGVLEVVVPKLEKALVDKVKKIEIN